MHFPTAAEVSYRNILLSIRSEIEAASKECRDFIDMTLCNDDISIYLYHKGYQLNEIRYEHKEINGIQKFGYHGRTAGDGVIKLRISWKGPSLNVKGNFEGKTEYFEG